MSRLDFAGESRRQGSRTMAVRKSRKQIRSGPGAEIDERARAAAAAKPVGHFGRTKSIFSNENNEPEKPPRIL
jgi:hypothetical protein